MKINGERVIIEKNKGRVFLLKRFLTGEFIRFVITGIINTAISWTISTFLFQFINYNLAFIIGYLVSMIVSYFLNCYFTFKTKPSWKNLVKFPLSYIPNFLIQYLFLTIGVQMLQMNKSITLLAAQVIAFPITFLVMKMVVFLKGKKGDEKK